MAGDTKIGSGFGEGEFLTLIAAWVSVFWRRIGARAAVEKTAFAVRATAYD
jgi:hypothetical protein